MAGEHVKRLIAAGRKHPNEPMTMTPAQALRAARERLAIDQLRAAHLLDIAIYQGRKLPGKN